MADLCMFGLTTTSTTGGRQEVFAKDRRGAEKEEPTKLMTNSARIGEELKRRCQGLHAHQRLMGGKRAQAAAKYPPELCRAICRGLMMEKKERVMGIRSLFPVGKSKEKWEGKMPDPEEHH